MDGWLTTPALNGTTGSASYRKEGNVVMLTGAYEGISSHMVVGNLPVSYRPKHEVMVVGFANRDAIVLQTVMIRPNGDIEIWVMTGAASVMFSRTFMV